MLPPRNLWFWIAIAGVALAAVGAKWDLIDRFATDVPFMDQWNGEGIAAIQPWANERIDFSDTFWKPHNEHRIGWTRLWALGLTALNGQWDPLFAVTLNALVHAAGIVLLMVFVRPLMAGPARWLVPGIALAALALPVAWENTLFAFQIQFYLVLMTGVAHVALTASNDLRSWRWWVGMLAGVAGLATMSSSIVAPVAVCVARVFLACRSRKWTIDDTVTLAGCAAIALAAFLLVTPVAAHEPLRAHGIGQFLNAFLRSAAYPFSGSWWMAVFIQAPVLVLVFAVIRNLRRDWSATESVLLSLIIFAGGQTALLAFARGGGAFPVLPRYVDTYMLLLVLDAGAFGALWMRSEPIGRRVVAVFSGVWALVVITGLMVDSQRQTHGALVHFSTRWETHRNNLRDFLIHDDEARFRAIPTEQLPFVAHTEMIDILRDPNMRRLLPASIRLPVALESEQAEGFIEGRSPSLPEGGPDGRVFSSEGNDISVWRSAPLALNPRLPILRLVFAGDPRLPPSAIRLETNDGRQTPLEIARFVGSRWQSAHLFVTEGAKTVRFVAEAGPGGRWLAFGEPVEIAFGSWLMRQARKYASPVFWAGLAFLIAGILVGSRRRLEGTPPGPPPPATWKIVPQLPSRHRAWGALSGLLEAHARIISWLIGIGVVAGTLVVAVLLKAQPVLFWRHVAALIVTLPGVLLPAAAAALYLRRARWLDTSHVVIVSLGVSALAGYVAFWFWFAHSSAGWAFSIAAAAAGGWFSFRNRKALRALWAEADVRTPLILMLVIAGFCVGVLHLHDISGNIDSLAAHRLIPGLSPDNQIPRLFAERLAANETPRHLLGDWLSSDRPPLQTGMILLAWPWFRLFGIESTIGAQSVGMWFQLFWIPAAWAVARAIGLRSGHARQVVAAMAFSGITLQHTVYVWPKLSGTAFALTAFSLVFFGDWKLPWRVPCAAALGSLAYLAHGGTAFAILGAAVLGLFRWPWPRFRIMLITMGVFAVFVLPWMAYQKVYEPPGNRLLKWHLAGVIPPDERGTLETIAQSYREAGGTAWSNKLANFHKLAAGTYSQIFRLDAASRDDRRAQEFFYVGRSFGPAILGAFFLPWLWLNSRFGDARKPIALLLAWVALTLAVWCVLMFKPISIINHAGTLVVNVAVLLVLIASARTVGRWCFLTLAAAQVVSFAFTWLPHAADTSSSGLQAAGVVLTGASACALLFAAAREPPAQTAEKKDESFPLERTAP